MASDLTEIQKHPGAGDCSKQHKSRRTASAQDNAETVFPGIPRTTYSVSLHSTGSLASRRRLQI